MILWRAQYGLVQITFFADNAADALQRAQKLLGSPINRIVLTMEPM